VVRVGNTVRRPLNPGSEQVHRLLRHFENRGFGGAPHRMPDGNSSRD
jgi:hypothetical protein